MVSGWFKDREKLADLATKIDDEIKATAMYVTLHPCDDDMYAKSADCLTGSISNTTNDDIKRLSNLLIDIDPIRKSDISSTDEEHELALKTAEKVMKDLSDEGWPEPLVGDSGNGAHLIYKIDMNKTNENIELIKTFLESMAAKYDNDQNTVDTVVYNPGRVTKLYGTHARKGSDIPERPHRPAKILSIPDKPEVVTEKLLQQIIDSKPKKKENKSDAVDNKSTDTSDTGSTDHNFDIKKYLDRYDVKL